MSTTVGTWSPSQWSEQRGRGGGRQADTRTPKSTPPPRSLCANTRTGAQPTAGSSASSRGLKGNQTGDGDLKNCESKILHLPPALPGAPLPPLPLLPPLPTPPPGLLTQPAHVSFWGPLAPSAPAPPTLTIQEQKAPQAIGPPPYVVQTEAPPKSTGRSPRARLDLNHSLETSP